MACEAETGSHLVRVLEWPWGSEQVGIQRRSIGQRLGAVPVNGAEQPPVQEVAGSFEPVHQWADAAIAGLHRAPKFIVLPLMAWQAFLGALVRLVGTRRLRCDRNRKGCCGQ